MVGGGGDGAAAGAVSGGAGVVALAGAEVFLDRTFFFCAFGVIVRLGVAVPG